MLGNFLLHDTVELFFLLMRIHPSFIEMGHKIGPIIHVWGRSHTGCQFVKLLIVPLGCVTDHQGKSPSDLSLSVRHVLDGKVILALPNEMPGFCGGFPCECLGDFILGGHGAGGAGGGGAASWAAWAARTATKVPYVVAYTLK